MSDKYLTTKEWQKFAAGKGYKDAGWVKALGAAEKAANAPPSERLPLLDTLETAGRDLQKQNKGDKKLESYLDEVYQAVKDSRKDAEKLQAKEEKAGSKAVGKGGKDDGDEGDDEKASILLDPKRLLAQLTLCKRDPERNVQFAYVDGKDKAPGVVAMSPRLGGRKMFGLLCDAVGMKTGAYGTAWVDGSELMLQLDKPLSGLVKKMRAPIRACGFKATKIVLWNADGSVFEQDATPDDRQDPDDPSVATAIPPAPPLPTDKPVAPTTTDKGPDELAFTARLKALVPRIVAAAATKEGQAAKLLASEAGVLARKADYTGANGQLDKVERLLARLGTPAPSGTAPTPPGGGRLSLAALARARLAWRSERLHAIAEISRLQAALAQRFDGVTDQAQALNAALARLSQLIASFGPDLDDSLDEVLNASEAGRPALIAQARALMQGFQKTLDGDEVMAELDGNEVLPDMSVTEPMRSALGNIGAALG